MMFNARKKRGPNRSNATEDSAEVILEGTEGRWEQPLFAREKQGRTGLESGGRTPGSMHVAPDGSNQPRS